MLKVLVGWKGDLKNPKTRVRVLKTAVSDKCVDLLIKRNGFEKVFLEAVKIK